MAFNNDKPIIPLQIDHAELDSGIEFYLSDVQRIPAYHLPVTALEKMKEEILKVIPVEKKILRKKHLLMNNWESYENIPIADLRQRIEASRRKIFKCRKSVKKALAKSVGRCFYL